MDDFFCWFEGNDWLCDFCGGGDLTCFCEEDDYYDDDDWCD